MRTTLITNDMIKLVKSSLPYGKIEKYDFNRFVSVYIGRAAINHQADGKLYLSLEETFDSRYARIWRNDVGEVLRKELSKNEPEIYEFVSKNFKALLKKVRDDEKESLAQMGLVHLIAGDSFYTIIRIIKPEGSYSVKDTKNDYYSDFDIEDLVEDFDDEDDDEEMPSVKLF